MLNKDLSRWNVGGLNHKLLTLQEEQAIGNRINAERINVTVHVSPTKLFTDRLRSDSVIPRVEISKVLREIEPYRQIMMETTSRSKEIKASSAIKRIVRRWPYVEDIQWSSGLISRLRNFISGEGMAVVPGCSVEEAASILKAIDEECAGFFKARDDLVTRNLRLVQSMARKYPTMSPRHDDLCQEGVMGLMMAAERFDVRKGFRFTTYACHWIIQRMMIITKGNNRAVAVPCHLSDKIMKKMADGAELSNFERETYATMMGNVLLLDHPMNDDDKNPCMFDIGYDEMVRDEIDELSAIDLVSYELSKMNDRHASVIRMRFGLFGEDTHTLEEVSEKLGVTRERIRQIEVKALKMLKRSVPIKLVAAGMIGRTTSS